jgi:exopolysaccharide biosynthesis polyprenyl glycosylphosphotransferase
VATAPEIGNIFDAAYEWLDSSELGRDRSSNPARHWHTTQLLLVLTDLLTIWSASAISLAFRFWKIVPLWDVRRSPGLFHIGVHAALLLLYSGVVVMSCHTHHLYRILHTRNGWHETWDVIRSVAMATVLLSTLIFLLRAGGVSRAVVAVTAILSTASLAWVRHLRRKNMATRVASGYNCRNVLIVGAEAVGRALRRYLNDNKQFGYLVKGFVSEDRQSALPQQIVRGRLPIDHILGSVEDLPSIARAHFIDELLITIPNDRELVKRIAAEARRCGLAVRVVPDLYDGLAWRAPIEYLGLFPTMSLHHEPIREVEFLLKRMMDVVLSALALVCLVPVMIMAACAIYLDDPGPIFYRSLRVGKKGQTFHCLKFRTMVVDADQKLSSLRHLNERKGLLFKISNDPRITRVGRWLRKYSVDELPQFWNVLKGEMSLVGPRPPLVTEFANYDLEYFRRLEAVPGITGLWQVEARQDSSFENYINLDLQYVKHWSLKLDMKLLVKTIAVVFAGTGR